MKTYAIISGIGIAVLNVLGLLPALAAYGRYFFAGAVALALWLVFRAVAHTEPLPEPVVAPPASPEAPSPPTPATAPDLGKAADSAAVALLGVFQEKGRLVDFLMDDVTRYSDAQVGAAARVVHQGCKAALREHFDIQPISEEKEGTRVTIPDDAPPGGYRLVGKVGGQGPQAGNLVHKGWRTASVSLPRALNPDAPPLTVIAPAQVDVR